MNKIKKYLKPSLVIIGLITLYLLILTFFGYTGMFSLNTIGVVNFIIVTIIMLILGIKKGKKASKNGYLEGLKYGSIIVLVLFITNLLFYRTFNLYTFLYYLVLISSTTIGSILGINIKH